MATKKVSKSKGTLAEQFRMLRQSIEFVDHTLNQEINTRQELEDTVGEALDRLTQHDALLENQGQFIIDYYCDAENAVNNFAKVHETVANLSIKQEEDIILVEASVARLNDVVQSQNKSLELYEECLDDLHQDDTFHSVQLKIATQAINNVESRLDKLESISWTKLMAAMLGVAIGLVLAIGLTWIFP